MWAAPRLLDVRRSACRSAINGIVVIRVCNIMGSLVGSPRAASLPSPARVCSPSVRRQIFDARNYAVGCDTPLINVTRPVTSEEW